MFGAMVVIFAGVGVAGAMDVVFAGVGVGGIMQIGLELHVYSLGYTY